MIKKVFLNIFSDSIIKCSQLSKKINDFDLVIFNVGQPFAGTPMTKTCIEKGYLPKDFDPTDEKQYGNSTEFITTPEFTSEDLRNLRTYAWDYINFKNHDKKVRAAACLNVPLSEIDEHKRQIRMRKGVHTVKQNFSLNRSMDKSFLARRKHSNQANGANNEMHIIKQKLVDARNKKEMHYD